MDCLSWWQKFSELLQIRRAHWPQWLSHLHLLLKPCLLTLLSHLLTLQVWLLVPFPRQVRLKCPLSSMSLPLAQAFHRARHHPQAVLALQASLDSSTPQDQRLVLPALLSLLPRPMPLPLERRLTQQVLNHRTLWQPVKVLCQWNLLEMLQPQLLLRLLQKLRSLLMYQHSQLRHLLLLLFPPPRPSRLFPQFALFAPSIPHRLFRLIVTAQRQHWPVALWCLQMWTVTSSLRRFTPKT